MISNPHSGTLIPPEIAETMTEAGLERRDTDWHLTKMYDIPCVEAAAMISANINRYVVDLNRGKDDQSLYPGKQTTGLIPQTTFAGQPIYKSGFEPDGNEVAKRVEHYWQPYHDQLEAELRRLIDHYGFAVLLDVHSVAPVVPMLFEGELPDFNFGTNNGESCGASLQELIEKFATEIKEFTHVINGRFIGGFITRNYGSIPEVHAVQLELKRSTYMEEDSLDWDMALGQQVMRVVEDFVYQLMKWAESHPGRK